MYPPQQEDVVRKVGLSRYGRVSRSAFGLNGKKRVAVLRTAGAILGEPCLQHGFIWQPPVRSLKLLPVVEPKHKRSVCLKQHGNQEKGGTSGAVAAASKICAYVLTQ
jgi:hypothetical protein